MQAFIVVDIEHDNYPLLSITNRLSNKGVSDSISTLPDMRNSFNLLLVALACFDNVYLFGGILEAVHRCFGVESKAHVILFPYLLYPVHAIGMTGSVLLTVAIALERCDIRYGIF